MSKLTIAIVASVLAFAVTGPASGDSLFFDDFESGNLTDHWAIIGNGEIVIDPLDGSNHVLAFSDTTTGGDILSKWVGTTTTESYFVTFGYFGTLFDEFGDLIDDKASGGFIGYKPPGGAIWIAGTNPTYITNGFKTNVLADDLGWQEYTIVIQPGENIQLTLEDFAFDGTTAGNAYFDNIRVTAVPTPTSLAALGSLSVMGLVGFGLRRGRNRRAA